VSIGRFRHRVPLRVRWAEVDMQAVVFNGHYLTYADVCATEYWRAIGVPYPAGFAGLGIDAFVRKATVEYHAPARYDDELLVCGRMARLGGSSASFAVAMVRAADESRALVEAELVYVCVDRSGAPTPWPAALRERIAAFETEAPAQGSARG
jgi:acyl-CoA thioester hydrolase